FENISFEELRSLCDCFYLPHENGVAAEQLLGYLRQVLERRANAPLSEVTQRVRSLRQTCARISEISNRPIFYALSRRIWELREELDLLDKSLAFRADPQNTGKAFTSDFHLPQTYRGGFVPRLQKL